MAIRKYFGNQCHGNQTNIKIFAVKRCKVYQESWHLIDSGKNERNRLKIKTKENKQKGVQEIQVLTKLNNETMKTEMKRKGEVGNASS